MENSQNTNSENRIVKVFKSIKEAFSFAWSNPDKSPKIRSNTSTNDVYVSYILNQTQED